LEERGIDPRKAERAMMTPAGSIQKWLDGEAIVNIVAIQWLCAALRIDPMLIFNGHSTPVRTLRPEMTPAQPGQVEAVLASAQMFRVAIDALPVGKDIRTRLNVHLDAHINLCRALSEGSAQ
jgi:hypothetical protein